MNLDGPQSRYLRSPNGSQNILITLHPMETPIGMSLFPLLVDEIPIDVGWWLHSFYIPISPWNSTDYPIDIALNPMHIPLKYHVSPPAMKYIYCTWSRYIGFMSQWVLRSKELNLRKVAVFVAPVGGIHLGFYAVFQCFTNNLWWMVVFIQNGDFPNQLRSPNSQGIQGAG